jgi:hypothetical protein
VYRVTRMAHWHIRARLSPVVVAVALVATTMPVAAQSDSLVTNQSPRTMFAQNKQNEPGLAVDANHPNVLVAGANEEIDVEACNAGNPTSCPFTAGIGTSGVYFSFDSGHSWTQPTYTGLTARDCLGPAPCTPHVGSIGTLPWYFEAGLVSDGDPSLAFGPRPGPDGFSWANGSRLYYTNLTSNLSSIRSEQAVNGFEAIAISRTDDVAAAATNDQNAWMRPVIVSRQNSALFSDHEQVWADNTASSPFFGNVYVCFAAFRSQEKGNALPAPIKVGRSTDGGDTWTERQLSAATNNSPHPMGRQDCGVRTNSRGTVFAFWQGGDVVRGVVQNAIFVSRSFDGGLTFEKARPVAHFENCGVADPVSGDVTFDGLAGARTGSFPSLDIANGAPTGAGATDEVVVTWCEGPTPTTDAPGPNERALVLWSADRGASYSGPVAASPVGDRPDFPAIAIAPDGSRMYLVYDSFSSPWQTTTTSPRGMQGVVRTAVASSVGTPGTFSDLHRGAIGDARGSSANALADEFLGDYNNAVATRTFGVGIWNDVRNAADCPAVDTYRQSLSTSSPGAKPAPNNVCPPTFGNSDIFAFSSAP